MKRTTYRAGVAILLVQFLGGGDQAVAQQVFNVENLTPRRGVTAEARAILEKADAATWYFSKQDYLPRRVERRHRAQGSLVLTELELRDLVIDSKIEEGELNLALPEGFKKTDDFAPNRSAYR